MIPLVHFSVPWVNNSRGTLPKLSLAKMAIRYDIPTRPE
jgi:hypothetical protein